MRAAQIWTSLLNLAARAAQSLTRAPKAPSPAGHERMQANLLEKFLQTYSPPKEGEDGLYETAITDVLDRAALFFTGLIFDETRDESGSLVISLKERREFFELGQDWIVKRKKTDLGEAGSGDRGVQNMQDRINSARTPPAQKPINGVAPPPKKVGRPTKAEAAQRKAYRHAQIVQATKENGEDDSGWINKLADRAIAVTGAG